jgi:NAD(P)-dependent dehydrogenase (short-subunit alcohol dehydrogenase family)
VTDSKADLGGNTILVTGASRGIGRASALEFARRGAHVLCLARTAGALEELDDEIAPLAGGCSLIPVDLTDGEALRRLPPVLMERFGKLDGLVLNAGTLGELTPVTDIDEKLWESAFALNVTANRRLLALTDPLLRLSEAGRVIGLTSSRAQKAVPFWAVYSATKAAFERIFLTYAEERRSTAIRANLLDPGPVATRMRAKAMPGEDPETITQPEETASLIADMASPAWDKTGETVRWRDLYG